MFSPAPTKIPPRLSKNYGAIPKDEEQGIAKHRNHPKTEVLQPDMARSTIMIGIVLYAFCSSSQLVANKVAMNLVPDASFLLLCQLLTCVLVVNLVAFVHPSVEIEGLTFKKAKPFVVVSVVFYLALLTNTEALKTVNVDMVIVVRSCSPIAVALLERLTLGRALPSRAGIISLVAIASGAVLYFVTNGMGVHSNLREYLWLSAYFVCIVIEMVWMKFVVDTVPMSTWTRVYYKNFLSLPLVLMSSLVLGELKTSPASLAWDTEAALAVGLSCVTGVGISWAGFNLLKLISATSFTVVGVVCKLFSVLISDNLGMQHSNLFGHCGLLICILAGAAYEKTKT